MRVVCGVIVHGLLQWWDGSWRFCVDFRMLSAVTHQDYFTLKGSTLPITLDLASRCWQVKVEEEDKGKWTARPLIRIHQCTCHLMGCILAGLTGDKCPMYWAVLLIILLGYFKHRSVSLCRGKLVPWAHCFCRWCEGRPKKRRWSYSSPKDFKQVRKDN